MKTPRYTFQCVAVGMPRSPASTCGTDRNVAVMMKCSANTPAYSGRSAGRASMSASAASSRDSAPPVRAGSTGTARCRSASPASAMASMMRKMPGTPIAASSTGASTSARTKDRPMLMPTNAIARVRTCGPREVGEQRRHRCGHGPRPLHAAGNEQHRHRVGEHADQRAGRVEEQADGDDRLAAVAVRPAPELDLQQRLGEPVGAHGEAEQFRGIVGQLTRVERQHRQQQEQPQHPRGVDGRKRADRAALVRRERRPRCFVRGSDWRCLWGWAYISRLPARGRDPDACHGRHTHSRCAHAQPAGDRPRPAARPADRHHGAFGLREVLARLRHDLRRGPAALRGVAVRLRPAVPVGHGEAGRRPHRGALARDRDRAEGRVAQSALHGRHGHRGLRLPARALRAGRRAALPRARPGTRRPEREPDGGPGARAAGRHGRAAARAGGAGAQG